MTQPPSESVPPPNEADPAAPSGPVRTKAATLLGGGPWRFLRQWGFPLFVVLVLVIGRSVLLPFVFAGLIAYILAPVVTWMAERQNGTTRMPRGLAIVICYIIFLSAIVGFLFLLVPRLSKDVARIGKEAPALYKRINEEWTPGIARWIERRFPGAAPKRTEEVAPVVPDVPTPPGTAFTLAPLPDGSYAVMLSPAGIDVRPLPGGGFHLETNAAPPEPQSVEEKIRSYMGKALAGLQGKANDVVRFGQALITGLIKGVFQFFLTLMIGAFILIDREKVHVFLRSLFPPVYRPDYDVIIAGIDRGLSGVIRGQLLICLVNGVLTYIGLIIFSVKYSLILAVVASVMSLIPIFGSILSTIPIVLAALVSGDSGLDIFRGVAMTLWIVMIHFVEANLLNPKIIGSAAKIHPTLVIFSLILGEHSYGLVGALLAVPVLSSIQVVFVYLYKKTWQTQGRRGTTTEAPIVTPPPAAPGVG